MKGEQTPGASYRGAPRFAQPGGDLGKLAELGKLTPRESRFVEAYVGGKTMQEAYLLISPDVGEAHARTSGSRMLKRIKKKSIGRAFSNLLAWARCALSLKSISASMPRPLISTRPRPFPILRTTLLACALLSFSLISCTSARPMSTSTLTLSRSSPLQSQRINSPMRIDFSRLPEVINPKFYPLLWDHKRFNVLYGGAGSGKSVFETQRLTFRMVAEKGHNVLGVRKVDKANRDSTFAQMVQTINGWGLRDAFHIGIQPLSITCKHNGNAMLFRGLDDPEKLKSITFPNGPLTDIWVEEASQITPADDKDLRLRLRGYAAVPKQMTYTFNPIDALHWLKGRFFDNPLAPERATVLKTTYKDNAWLAPDDRAELEALKDEDLTYYQIYALGEWGVIGNVVFSNYVIEDFPYGLADFDAVYQGQDYGFNHPFAFELVGMKDGELYIFDEVYKRQRTNTELIEDSRQYFEGRKILLPVMRGTTTADSAEPDRIKEWGQAGWRTIASKKGPGSERFGIDFMKHKRMHIHHSRCPGIAAEIPIFKYREDKNGNVLEEFVDFKNDGIAAVRYATESMHRPRGAKVSWA